MFNGSPCPVWKARQSVLPPVRDCFFQKISVVHSGVSCPGPEPGEGRDGCTTSPGEAGAPRHRAAKGCCSLSSCVPLLMGCHTTWGLLSSVLNQLSEVFLFLKANHRTHCSRFTETFSFPNQIFSCPTLTSRQWPGSHSSPARCLLLHCQMQSTGLGGPEGMLF